VKNYFHREEKFFPSRGNKKKPLFRINHQPSDLSHQTHRLRLQRWHPP